MADSSALFKLFNDKITVTATEKKYLRKARQSITNKLKINLANKPQIPPFKFKVQGSFTMNTLVRPLNGEFDIDIGVYFDFPYNDRDKWTKPPTVSGWLKEALFNHTSTPIENKKTCVRVIYKSTNNKNEYGYHVDLPIYGKYKDFWDDEYTVIGMNDEREWNEKSDPLAFTKWFNKKCLKNEKDKKQLIRLVKYLKAWKDFKSDNVKMPSGMILTVLAAKNFEPNDRDDVALQKLLVEIHYLLWWSFYIEKPVAPKNNLVSSFTTEQKEYFMENLKAFRDDANKAIESKNINEAITLWKNHFGDRFPNSQ